MKLPIFAKRLFNHTTIGEAPVPEELAHGAQLEDRDVLVLYNGANLHPEFISLLPNVMKVYTFGDPESVPILAQPIAPAFDVHLLRFIEC